MASRLARAWHQAIACNPPSSVLIPFRLRRIPYGTPCRFHTMLRIDLVRKSRLKQGYRLAFYKTKSTRLFVTAPRPNPLCSTKNKNHHFGGFLFLVALGWKNPCAKGAGFDYPARRSGSSLTRRRARVSSPSEQSPANGKHTPRCRKYKYLHLKFCFGS